MKFYHNNRCKTSREALDMLKLKGHDPEVVEYMKEPLTQNELSEIVQKLDMSPEDLIRKNEATWKEEFADKELTHDELVLAMIEHPRLMQRPILVNGDKAAVGRPKENLLEIV